MVEQNNCVDCGKNITKLANRCRVCANKKYKRFLGKIHTEDYKEKMRKIQEGDNNPNWKGDKVGIKSLHNWIRRRKPKPELCERCKKVPPYDLANISGEYKRDVNDYEWLCRSCHSKEHRGKEWSEKMKEFKLIKYMNYLFSQ